MLYLCQNYMESTRRWANSLAHAEHPVDLLYAKPMKDIWHKGLEAHILNASDVLRPLEVVRSSISASLSCIVNHFTTQSAI